MDNDNLKVGSKRGYEELWEYSDREDMLKRMEFKKLIKYMNDEDIMKGLQLSREEWDFIKRNKLSREEWDFMKYRGYSLDNSQCIYDANEIRNKIIKGKTKEEFIEYVNQDENKELRETLKKAACIRVLRAIFAQEVQRYDESCYEEIMNSISNKLLPKEQEVFISRYGLDSYNCVLPLAAVARQLQVTKECVRQREVRALRKLRGRTYNSLKRYVLSAEEFKDLENSRKIFNLYKSGKITRNEMLEAPIDVLGLSVRSYNCLQRAGIQTITDLLVLTEDELRRVRNLGRKGTEEILESIEPFSALIEEKKSDPDGESE